MKDEKDKQTVDMFGEQVKPGRPTIYANPAERQRAYRRCLKLSGRRVISFTVYESCGVSDTAVNIRKNPDGGGMIACYESGRLKLQAHTSDDSVLAWLEQAWSNRVE